MIRGVLAALFLAIASPAFAECGVGYNEIQVPICQQTTVAPGFYVATNGNDSNAGTLAAPFATLGKCQTAMQGSGIKTCYIRAGSYAPAGVSAGCNSRGSCAVVLGGSDSGETWSYYPPDGYNSADITGGSTSDGSGGLWSIFEISTTNVTINGLSMHNYEFSAVQIGGQSGITVTNSLMFNGFGYDGSAGVSGASNAAAIMCYSCANATISHNVIHDEAGFGVSISNGGTSNLVYNGNFLYNICTQSRDCGALYTQDTPQTSTNLTITNNYIHDGCLASGCSPGSGGWGSAIYLDDCASNATISGNVVTGNNGNNTIHIHGGHNNHITDNILDLSSLGNSISTFQSSTCSSVTGNTFQSNIIVSNGGSNSFNGLSGNATISNDFYHNYGSGTLSSAGDSNPVTGDPQLNCWIYNIASGSPVFNSPVSFVGVDRTWGPPGFVVPHTGTVPSSPHAC